MTHDPLADLSRREREIMDVLYRLGDGTAAEIRDALDTDATYSAVRSALRVLREKQAVAVQHQGKRYVYRPTERAEQVRESAVRHLVATFFEGSEAEAMNTLLRVSERRLDAETLDDLRARIDAARRQANS